MTTNARNERVAASEAASVLRHPSSTSGGFMPGSPSVYPGWMAGRLIDGFELHVDGQAPRWYPPVWLETLEGQGYDRSSEGDAFFVVVHARDGDLRRFANVRQALAYGRSLLERRRRPLDAGSLAIEARTSSGRVALVVQGRSFLGMAHGALDAKPITAMSSPAEF